MRVPERRQCAGLLPWQVDCSHALRIDTAIIVQLCLACSGLHQLRSWDLCLLSSAAHPTFPPYLPQVVKQWVGKRECLLVSCPRLQPQPCVEQLLDCYRHLVPHGLIHLQRMFHFPTSLCSAL